MNRRPTIHLFGAEIGKCLPLVNDVDIVRSAVTGLSPHVPIAKKLGNLVSIHTEKRRFLGGEQPPTYLVMTETGLVALIDF